MYNKNLSLWLEKYDLLLSYQKEYGNTEVPYDYLTPSKFRLGKWLSEQKELKNSNKLDITKLELLTNLGVFSDTKDIKESKVTSRVWLKKYKLVKDYYNQYGDILISSNYEKEGVNLAKWLASQRTNYKRKVNGLNKEQISLLNQVKMIWDEKEAKWYYHFKLLKEYFSRTSYLTILDSQVYQDFRLGKWYHDELKLADSKKLEKAKILALKRFNLVSRDDKSFYYLAIEYYLRKYYLDLLSDYRNIVKFDFYIPSLNIGLSLDSLAKNELRSDNHLDEVLRKRKTKLIRIREEGLKKTNFAYNYFYKKDDLASFESCLKDVFSKELNLNIEIDLARDYQKIYKYFNVEINDYWLINLEECKRYYKMHGSLTNIKEFVLAKFVEKEVKAYKEERLDEFKIKELEKLKIDWELNFDHFDDCLLLAKRYLKEYGHLELKENEVYQGFNLGKWLKNNKKILKLKSDPRRIKLEEIGFKFDEVDYETIWYKKYEVARNYYLEHGNLEVALNYYTDGFYLAYWLIDQRALFTKADKESIEKVKLLNEIGMIWETSDSLWLKRYELLKEYYLEKKSFNIKESLVYQGFKLGKWFNEEKFRLNEALSEEDLAKRALFSDLGISFDLDEWLTNYHLLTKYVLEYGSLPLKEKECYEGVNLAKWLEETKGLKTKDYETKKKLSLINNLEDLTKKDDWFIYYNLAKEYYKINGNLQIKGKDKFKGYELGKFITKVRNQKRKGKLAEEKIILLEKLGIKWDIRKTKA